MNACRAGIFAGRRSPFVNGKRIRDGLRISLIDGFPVYEPCIKFIGNINRTDFCTITASGTFFKINKSGFLFDMNGEIPCRAFKLFDFSIG